MKMTDEPEKMREQGVEFGSLSEDLEDESYPLTGETLLSEFGDYTLEFEDGRATVREVLEVENERRFEDSKGVRRAIFTTVDAEAIGRDTYSNRGGATPGEDRTRNRFEMR